MIASILAPSVNEYEHLLVNALRKRNCGNTKKAYLIKMISSTLLFIFKVKCPKNQ